MEINACCYHRLICPKLPERDVFYFLVYLLVLRATTSPIALGLSESLALGKSWVEFQPGSHNFYRFGLSAWGTLGRFPRSLLQLSRGCFFAWTIAPAAVAPGPK